MNSSGRRYWEGRYIGEGPLHGKTALLCEGEEGEVKAQFDDLTLPQAYGWHAFPATDFREI